MIKILIILCGGSSAGKDRIQNIISEKYNIPICVSSTTRPMRVGEIDGKSYHFMSDEKFINDLYNGKFLEHRAYETKFGIWYYGLSADSVDKNKTQITIVDQKGYYEVVDKLGEENVLGIYIYAPERIKIQRALDREKDNNSCEFFQELFRRFLDDLTAFEKVKKDKKIFQVENVDLEEALNQVEEILKDNNII